MCDWPVDDQMTTVVSLSPLNAIIDVEETERAGWTPIDFAASCLSGGARFLQLRAKTLSGAAFLDLASRICELAHAAGAIVVVNDRADVARLAGADGLHVGQEDLPVPLVRAVLGADAIVGLSTHTEPQIDAAIGEPVSYLAVGPVFGTSTKATGYAAIGLERVRYAANRLGGRPRSPGLVAIGGITLENAAEVLDAGATAVAVIRDLLSTANPEARVRAYLTRLADRGAEGAKV
jgi:thiamine-phosphate pyrophosphorylase